MRITTATVEQAPRIATLIMEAMNHECCQYFAGENHSLDEFHQMMTRLVEQEDSQYSFRNTLVALDQTEEVAGICVSYDGALLKTLRQAFIKACIAAFDRDFSDMPDETSAGELYVDSLAIDVRHRGQGLARQLLQATIAKARQMNIDRVGLLVDKGNPKAERLYSSVGFRYANDNSWGGHPMKHFVYDPAADQSQS